MEEVNFNCFPGAILIIVFSLVISSGSASADDKADVVAVVNWFLDNLGYDTLGKAVIIDEFPPHEWHGPTAYADWWKALNAYNQKNEIAEGPPRWAAVERRGQRRARIMWLL